MLAPATAFAVDGEVNAPATTPNVSTNGGEGTSTDDPTVPETPGSDPTTPETPTDPVQPPVDSTPDTPDVSTPEAPIVIAPPTTDSGAVYVPENAGGPTLDTVNYYTGSGAGAGGTTTAGGVQRLANTGGLDTIIPAALGVAAIGAASISQGLALQTRKKKQ